MSDKKTTEIEISDAVKAIAEAAKKSMTIAEGGIVEVPKDFYESLLPEGVSLKDVQKVQQANSTIIAGVGLALGDVGLAAFKKDKKLEQLSVSVNAGKDKLEVGLSRSRTSRNPTDGSEIVKHGVLSANWRVAAAGNRGDFKKVRDNVAERAAKMFG